MKERVMSVRIRRVVVAWVAAAVAVAVPAAALASSSPSGKGAPSTRAASESAAAASKSAAVKSEPSVDPSAAAASKSAAAAAEPRVDRSLTGPVVVAALASRLGVSYGAAQHALQQIGALSGQGGVDPTAPAFVAIARGLGVSPDRLAAALGGVKQALAGK
jgi:hypothetical protein